MSRHWRTGIGSVVIALSGALVATVPAHATVDDSDGPPDRLGGDASVSPLAAGRGVGNVAHKGASIQAPENTLASVRQAIARRSNFVGIDVRRTRDNRLVVFHDQRLRRTTDVEKVFPRRAHWPVSRFTLAEVKRLDAGTWKSSGYTRERVPTLAEVLREVRRSSTGLFLEIKQPHLYGGVNGIGDRVVGVVRQHTNWLRAGGSSRRLVVQAFNDGFLRAFESRYGNIVVGTLGGVRRLREYSRWADQVNAHHRDVDARVVDRAHRYGLKVSTFVVNRRATMRRVVRAGVDAISTDRPERLYRVLRSRDRVMRGRRVPGEPQAAALRVQAQSRALLRTRVPVVARVRGRDGNRARWTWVRVQLRRGDRWRNLQRRTTDRLGNLRTTVRTRHRLRLRVVSETTDWYRRARPVVRNVDTRRWPTQVRLFGDRRLRGDDATRLRVRWEARNGRQITGRATLRARRPGKPWQRIRTISITRGRGGVRVSPNRDTRYRLRARRGSWWAGDRDGHVIDHLRRRR